MRLDTNNLNPILSGLSHSDLEELVSRYCFSNDSVSEIIRSFQLNCSPGKLLKALPMIFTDFRCPHCGQNMVRKVLSKSTHSKVSDPFCPHCLHQKSNSCTCYHCKKNNFLDQNYLSEQDIITAYLNGYEPLQSRQSFTDLSLKDTLYLLALIRSSMTVNSNGHIGPLTDVPPLAPHGEKTVLIYLIDRDLITISTESDKSAFTIEQGEVKQYDIMSVKFEILLDDFQSAFTILTQAIESADWPTRWRPDIKSVWQEIAVMECTEYLEYIAYERGYKIDITAEIRNIFYSLLQKYSASQCFNIILHSARKISDNLVKNVITKEAAGHELIKLCYHHLKQQVNIKNGNRSYNLTQSQLSYLFHYDFLRIGEKGFTDCPYMVQRIKGNNILSLT